MEKIRFESVKNPLRPFDPRPVVNISSIQFANEDGDMVTYHMKDRGGNRASLVINGQIELDPQDPYDKELIDVLQLFMMSSTDLVMYDNNKIAEDKTNKAMLTFEVMKHLAAPNVSNDVITKIYRHIVGLVGRTSVAVMKASLMEKAQVEPDKFFSAAGDILFESEWFPYYSLVEESIERGILSRTQEGHIVKQDGTLLGKDLHGSALELQSDKSFKVFLEDKLSGKHQESERKTILQAPGNFDILEKRRLIAANYDVEAGSDKAGLVTNADERATIDALIDKNWTKLTQKGYIEMFKSPDNNPRKNQYCLSSDESKTKYSKPELVGILKSNEVMFNNMLIEAGLKA